MQNILIGLLTTVLSNASVQAIIQKEIAKFVPASLSGIVNAALGLLGQTTAPASSTTVTVPAGPSQTVRNVQHDLNIAGYLDDKGEPLKEDGYLGPKTEAAIKWAAGKLGLKL